MSQVHAVRGEMKAARNQLRNRLRKRPITLGGRMTPLDKPLRREVMIEDRAYTLTLDPHGLKLVEKGRRKGLELAWADMVNGDAALAAALQGSLAKLR
jgi:hypothetical protein